MCLSLSPQTNRSSKNMLSFNRPSPLYQQHQSTSQRHLSSLVYHHRVSVHIYHKNSQDLLIVCGIKTTATFSVIFSPHPHPTAQFCAHIVIVIFIYFSVGFSLSHLYVQFYTCIFLTHMCYKCIYIVILMLTNTSSNQCSL